MMESHNGTHLANIIIIVLYRTVPIRHKKDTALQ